MSESVVLERSRRRAPSPRGARRAEARRGRDQRPRCPCPARAVVPRAGGRARRDAARDESRARNLLAWSLVGRGVRTPGLLVLGWARCSQRQAEAHPTRDAWTVVADPACRRTRIDEALDRVARRRAQRSDAEQHGHARVAKQVGVIAELVGGDRQRPRDGAVVRERSQTQSIAVCPASTWASSSSSPNSSTSGCGRSAPIVPQYGSSSSRPLAGSATGMRCGR